jgi:hypothetical protein
MKSSYDRKDRLERFVRDNRPGFDSEEPDDQLWNKIADKLPPGQEKSEIPAKKTVKWRRQVTYDWRVAATLVVLVGLGLLTYVNQKYGLARDPEMVLQAPSYAREMNLYTQVINEKRNELKKLTLDKPELYEDFSTELFRLENAYSGLRSDLPVSPDPESHLHAMVQNLQWQIDLLNQQITIIEKIKKANEEDNSRRSLMAI